MDKKIDSFLFLADIFSKNGYQLFLVGGTVRDYLLGLPLTDMDAVTDATPDEMKAFIPDGNFTFAKYGNVGYKFNGTKFDLTSLRKEDEYADSRHPNSVIFVKDLSIDVRRRDFTINAIYLDRDMKIIDYVGGQNDLRNHLLRMIGDPDKRIKEDPLRIIRALRFALDFNLSIDEELESAIKCNSYMLDNLNKDKILEDLKKIRINDKDKIRKIFHDYNIKLVLDMLE